MSRPPEATLPRSTERPRPRTRDRAVVRLGLIAPILIGCLALPACRGKKPPAPTATKVEYTVRGVVMRLPDPADPLGEMQVHHEAIPSFRESMPDGKLGMKAMTMPFPIAPGLKLDGVEAGDKVVLTFEVEYAIDTGMVRGWRAVRIAELPPDTGLEFESAPVGTSENQ